MHILFQHPERLWLVILWLGIVAVLLWRSYAGSVIRGGRRVAAIACKALAALLLGACLLDPVHITEAPKKGANEIIILADNSASLSIAEQAKGKTRGDEIKSALLKGPQSKTPTDAAWIDKLSEHFRVRMQSLDDRVRGIDSAAALDFKGPASALCSSVQTARDQRSGAVAAVVVLSDGNATDPQAWAPQSLSKGAPVFTVLVGEKAPACDLSLRTVTAQQTPFEDSPVTITATVDATGFAGKAVALRVLDEAGKEVAKEIHTYGAAEMSYVYRPRVPWSKPGVAVFRVQCSPALADKATPGGLTQEATLDNNTRTLTVDRGMGPYRILYVAGRPNWEYKFLRRAMASDTEVQLPSLIRIAKREPKFEWRGRPGEASNPLFRGFGVKEGEEAQRYDQPVLTRLGTRDKLELVDGFPKTAELLMGEYRAIIIDDLEAEFFTQEQMNLVERFVSARGGSLLMLGGQECFGPGGYEATPIGRMLPVYLDKIGAAAPAEDARFALTREGWLEPWTRLRAEQAEDEQRMAAMPTFYSVNQAFSIKPGASILATLTDATAHNYPALVTQRYGTGRVVALTVGDVWRWGMKDPDASKDMDKMWRQMLRYLVTDVPDRMELRSVVRSVSGQDVVPCQVRLRDAAWLAQDDATVQLEVTSPDGKKTLLFTEPSLTEAGLFEAEYYPRKAGAYRVKATAKDSTGKALGEKTTGWALNPLADELASLAPNRALMERMANDTGGKVIAVADVASLAEFLPKLEVPVIERKSVPLWHNGWWLAAVVVLLAGEWALRRASGTI